MTLVETFGHIFNFLRGLSIRGGVKITITLRDQAEVDKVMREVEKELDTMRKLSSYPDSPRPTITNKFHIFGMEVEVNHNDE